MNYRILPVAILLASLAVPVGAQPGQVGGPSIGFVFDFSAHALRTVLGIPGASTMGAPLDAGFEMSSAWVAPHQDSAIAIDSAGLLHLLRLGSGVAETRCGACPAGAMGVTYSPSGSAVALYSAERVQIVTGLPEAPAAGASFEIRGPGASHVALSDDGAWLLVSTQRSVDLFAANGGPRQILETGGFALAAFAPGGHDAAIADFRRGTLTLIRDVAGASTLQPLAAPEDLRHARAVGFSSDGSRLFVANPTAQSVAAIDLATGAIRTATCNCAPGSLAAMGKVMRLGEAVGGPLWLLDAEGSGDPRVVFVPPAQ